MSNEQQNTQVDEQVEAAPEVQEQSAETVETVSEQDQQIAELTAKLAAAEAKVAEQQDSVVRAKAEVENIRRRSAQDVEKAHNFALEKFAGDLLPVVDNLQRALDAADKTDEALLPMIEGIELTQKGLDNTLSKFGIDVVAPQQGESLNPELHQAMSMVPHPDVAPNAIIDCLQKGYTINGRLLRPAMVIVSAAGGVDTQA